MAESRGGGVGRPAAWPSEVVAASRAVNLQISGAHEMMKARTSLWASLAIAASLGLAGCGGSNDNDEDMMDKGDMSTDPTAMSADISLTKAQSDALKTQLKENGESAELKNGDVRVGVTFSCTSDDPCTITVENSAGTIVATAHSTTSGTVTGVATGLEAPAIPAVSGSAGTALRSRLVASDVGTAGDLTLAGFPGVDSELKAPGDEDTKFTKSDTAPAELDGWTGETWTTGNQIIVRYTNQSVETVDDGTFKSRFGEADGGNSDELTSGHTTWDWELAESDDLPTGSKVETFSETGSFAGTYAGVEGKFSVDCGETPTSCGFIRNDDGEVESSDEDITGTWTFKADDETSAVSSYDKADPDYLAFGWWRRSVGASHAGIADFHVLHSGKGTPHTVVSGVTGKATYNGNAAGNYLKGVEGGSEGGEFVADVELEANFEDSDADSSKITATINKFRDTGGDSLGSWEVKLATTGGTTEHTGAAIEFDGTASSGTAGAERWATAVGGGNFYGPTANNAQPSGVAGWFRATTNNGAIAEDDVAVAGAFAATR